MARNSDANLIGPHRRKDDVALAQTSVEKLVKLRDTLRVSIHTKQVELQIDQIALEDLDRVLESLASTGGTKAAST